MLISIYIIILSNSIGYTGDVVNCYKYKITHRLQNYIWSINKFHYYKMSLLTPEQQKEYIKHQNDLSLLIDQLCLEESTTSIEACILLNLNTEAWEFPKF